MTDLYRLPQSLLLDGKEYEINTDFRLILKLFGVLDDVELPLFLRWQVALELFYKQPVPPQLTRQAIEAMTDFISCGRPQTPGPVLISWQQDAEAVMAGVNRAAGQELRALPYVHWWSFLGWFHAIGPGALSTLVGIRSKLLRKQKLEPWEQEFYRQNKSQVDLRPPETAAQRAHRQQLNEMLGQ